MKTIATVVMTLALFGCATTRTNDAATYIQTENPRFADAFSRGDWNAVTAYYADDAVLLMPNAEMMRGTAAIRQGFGAMQGMGATLKTATDHVVQSGDLAYETGTYQMSMMPPGGSLVNDRGKYLTVWRRQANGDWKIVADMINTSMPAPH